MVAYSPDNMKVADLIANSNVDEIILKIIEKRDVREVQRRFGGTARVCDLVGEDTDGDTVQITLWNDEIDTVEENETIRIKDGWVKEWNNELQVSTGRSGIIEKVL
jgi:ssDNA-binding replication factor A large subunit